ncbi:outer membrane protein assembly factor BamB family protein [Natronoflexus pectinivorans]|uniref:Putative pyrroloquinoline-quinone binding quinoprotein n=1 Tax=Natronoflexus pectinivorans TaxID=682526 RepID=A0A4R2GKN8_9BACT|nr:PQQ-binding-like beta-propeller repeat protein [Natronoflexus pectinivorans]TCO09394.1 putative pyrroloquinoline-quinone binding quinoprotein [Natronoflexus pectinivorans]
MRRIFIGLIILISSVSFGQKRDFQITHNNEKIVGINLIDNTEIKGTEYIFPERIHDTFLDTTNGFLTVQLRGLRKEKWLSNKGNILQYDLNNKNLMWSKKIAYQASSLQQFSNTMILTVANKSNCLDIRTGNVIWEVKNSIYYVDPIDNIGIGYRFKSSTGYSNELEGIDLKSGTVIWKRDLNREYGWNDIFYINDTTMIVVAAGLHSININSGKGWDYNTITGKKDYTGTVAANAVGVAAGLLTGTFVMSTGHNLVRDVVSNSLVDSSYIYFASKEQLSKIEKETGSIVWKYPFPSDLASKSSIFMNDSVIFMVNRGYAFMGYRQLDFGKPFIGAFDRETGQQKYLTLINVKKDPILGFEILDDEMYLVFKNRIAKYSVENGNQIIEKEFPQENYGDLKYFIGNQVFVTNEKEDLISLTQSDTSKVFVFTNQGKTLSIDYQLNVTNTIEYEDLSIYYLRTKDYKFVAKDKQTLIINDNGKRIAEIDATTNAFLIGETLYDKRDNSFIAIDLREIIKNE